MAETLGNADQTFPQYVVIIDGLHQPRTANMQEAAEAVQTAHRHGRDAECRIIVAVAQNKQPCILFAEAVNKRLQRSNWSGEVWNKCSVIPRAQFQFQA